jgi:hypothetical protein
LVLGCAQERPAPNNEFTLRQSTAYIRSNDDGVAADSLTVSMTILKGTIYRIGNEPFTSLALEDSAGLMHPIVEDTSEVYRSLERLQGMKVEIEADTSVGEPRQLSVKRVRVLQE